MFHRSILKLTIQFITLSLTIPMVFSLGDQKEFTWGDTRQCKRALVFTNGGQTVCATGPNDRPNYYCKYNSCIRAKTQYVQYNKCWEVTSPKHTGISQQRCAQYYPSKNDKTVVVCVNAGGIMYLCDPQPVNNNFITCTDCRKVPANV
ncbi:hypothetical protein DFH28DRAFT_935242 [Melampsora americana]|nr:hypothetical protein DFH28DRAFT_935242 [Melampsora americana]